LCDGLTKKAPEIVATYSLSIPVSAVRSRIRQEFERNRYVQELPVINVLLFKGLAEYQVCVPVTR
jgi:NADH dehydrogenase (ubiquinone) 1 alpha subcomplex subunit 6